MITINVYEDGTIRIKNDEKEDQYLEILNGHGGLDLTIKDCIKLDNEENITTFSPLKETTNTTEKRIFDEEYGWGTITHEAEKWFLVRPDSMPWFTYYAEKKEN